jgi:phosphoribosylformimino-5-aminoimidazole carboxamide ribotide isomerase
MNRWQTLTTFAITEANLALIAASCSELLIHAADVEGLCQGIDQELVAALGKWSPIPCVYAGGGKAIEDLMLVDRLSGGRVDLTYGSALDLFGGSGVKYADCVAWNQAQQLHRR